MVRPDPVQPSRAACLHETRSSPTPPPLPCELTPYLLPILCDLKNLTAHTLSSQTALASRPQSIVTTTESQELNSVTSRERTIVSMSMSAIDKQVALALLEFDGTVSDSAQQDKAKARLPTMMALLIAVCGIYGRLGRSLTAFVPMCVIVAARAW